MQINIQHTACKLAELAVCSILKIHGHFYSVLVGKWNGHPRFGSMHIDDARFEIEPDARMRGEMIVSQVMAEVLTSGLDLKGIDTAKLAQSFGNAVTESSIRLICDKIPGPALVFMDSSLKDILTKQLSGEHGEKVMRSVIQFFEWYRQSLAPFTLAYLHMISESVLESDLKLEEMSLEVSLRMLNFSGKAGQEFLLRVQGSVSEAVLGELASSHREVDLGHVTALKQLALVVHQEITKESRGGGGSNS